MMLLISRLVLSTWLFVSAFLLPQTTASAWNALIVASLVAAVSFLAFAMPGRPGLRWVNAVLATWLLCATMLLPHAGLGTVVHDIVMAMLIAGASFLPPARSLTHGREAHAATR